MRAKRNFFLFVSLIVAVPILFVFDILLGSVSIPISGVFQVFSDQSLANEGYKLIILQSRIPKAITAIICGAALSLSGLQMQALFRNPLAGPYILGISNGAGLGVALLVMGGSIFGITAISSIGVSLAAMIGAGLILILIFMFSMKIRDIMTVLIVGIMLGSVSAALIGVIQYISTKAALKNFVIWSMGSLEGLGYSEILLLLAFFCVGGLVMLSQLKNLNLLLLGESYSKSLGLHVKKIRILIILSTSLLAGSIAAFCGPIGFIGVVVPHLCRIIFKTSNHFVLFPACCLLGSSILLLSDIISHLPGSQMILPINSVTSIIGIPIILWMIVGKKSIAQAF